MNGSRPIVVVHGALGSARQMRPVAQAHEEIGSPVVVELPGHGETPLPDGIHFGFDVFVEAIANEVARIRRASSSGDALPVVFGYSMGGYAALALEARAPGSFAGIVTLGTKFEWTPEIAAREASRLDPDAIASKVPKFAAALAERHAGAGGWHGVVARTAALLRELGESPLLDAKTLGTIDIPVCVAVGSRDDTVTTEEAGRIASSMRNAILVTLPDTPHPIERVSPEDMQSLMRTLLSRLGEARVVGLM